MAKPTASDLHDFEVLAEVSRRNGDIRFAPLGTCCRTINYSAKRGGTEFTIGVDGNLCFDVEAGKFRGGLVLVDGAEFDRVKADMEAREKFRQHVRTCSRCILCGDGSVWTCHEGARLRQAALKQLW